MKNVDSFLKRKRRKSLLASIVLIVSKMSCIFGLMTL